MRNKIVRKLKELVKEEYSQATVENIPHEKEFYARPGRFIIERRRLSGLSSGNPTQPICVRTHLPLRHFPEHTHDYIEIMYVYSGTIKHIIGKDEIRVGMGELIILGKNTEHSIETSSKEDLGINLIISSDLFESLLAEIRKSSAHNTSDLQLMLDKARDVYKLYHTSDIGTIANIMDNVVYSGLMCDDDNEYILERTVHLLLTLLSQFDTSDVEAEPDTATRILNYIRTSYSTATLTECAYMLDISPAYLSRWCTKNLGLSFKELLMRERFSIASELLLKTDMSIGDIIINSGYENSSYFHKEFKERYGTTPNKYRKTRQ